MIQTGKELAISAKAVAVEHKTLYVLGCFGWPMSEVNKDRVIRSYAYNQKTTRLKKIQSADGDTFGFDCVNLIKALLWGWDGDTGNSYGSALYESNGVPDVNADGMIRICRDVTTDFGSILPGEAVWNPGHIGIYIGKGLAVEATPRWADGVQITRVYNLLGESKEAGRYWKKHGKLPFILYETKEEGYHMELRNLKKRCKGDDVKALQILLLGNAYECGDVDGIFGSRVEMAVKAFQQDRKLKVDGIVGKETMKALLGVEYDE